MKVKTLPALLPCPFCGSADAPSLEEGCWDYVVCDTKAGGCGAVCGNDKGKLEAITAWNRRPVIRKRTAGGSKQVFECAGCDSIGLHAHLSTDGSWLRVDLNRGLGLCSSCEHLVLAWDQLGLPHQTF